MGEASATEEKKEKREDEGSTDTSISAGLCADDQGESQNSQHGAGRAGMGLEVRTLPR